MVNAPSFNGDVLSQHLYSEALSSATRLFSASDTKWPDFLIIVAQQQLVSDLLLVSLHLRRVSESSEKKIVRKIDNMPLGIERDFSIHEIDLWAAINRVVHHHKLKPVIFTQGNFFRADDVPMAGHLIADVEVESDRGKSHINVAGFAIACVNEIGAQSVSPVKVFH